MLGQQQATRALHKRLAPGRCVEMRAAQKDACRAWRGRQRRRGGAGVKRCRQRNPPAAAEGDNHQHADVLVKLARMSMSDLKKLSTR